MKILVMGLPGAGKTWLSERLQKHLECAWYNADAVRKMANDWDFSPEGRVRQANRMRNIADYEKSHGRTVICDFVCPTQQTRTDFEADITIWVDTIESGRFEDTNKMFEAPINEMGTLTCDHHITHLMTDEEIEEFAKNVRI
jgi:adenylylsulfate kinase